MNNKDSLHMIKALRSKWIGISLLADFLLSVGIAFLLAIVTNKMLGWSVYYGVLYLLIVFGSLLLLHKPWVLKETAIAELLNQSYPQLEESAGLLLKQTGDLNLLEQLQYKRTSNALQQIESPLRVNRKIIFPAIAMLLLSVTALAIHQCNFNKPVLSFSNDEANTINHKKEVVLPQVAAIKVTVQPPAYTAKPVRVQQAFNLLAEEGSAVHWQLQTNIPVQSVKFILNDKTQLPLQSANAENTQWQLQRKIDSSGFYQLSIDGKLSELYKIETIPDKAPVINVLLPQQYTTIDFGQPQQVKLSAALTDDYGIKDAFINATIASGSGEAVKFKEEKIALQGFSIGSRESHLQQILSLKQMAMQPGDELYFYLQATDNHQQQTRSDIFIVHLPDTAQLMSLDGLANSLTLKPEYFRSQRQIIIETEQLLKDKDTISNETFKNRSNNLGIDQKLLRLRYGKFLGEEAESGEPETSELSDLSNFSNAEKVADAFTDKHDNSEDATYFDPETKKQLRATLTEMWNAELHLRTFTPQEALPFEYKALRLLKDLQQKSRVYVAKTNFKTTPLDPKKRLTGELTKINAVTDHKDIQPQTDPQASVRQALSVLQNINTKNNKDLPLQVLQQANLRLHEKAIQQPALYLDAIEAMKRIMNALPAQQPIAPADILAAQHGLQQLLTAPLRLPTANKDNTQQELSKQYFNNLQNKQP
ncbi:MAG: hypothetical protein QM726_02345 [Chitinophagaceae bacterium]